MRQPRKRRALRPTMLPLEALCPVSSLAGSVVPSPDLSGSFVDLASTADTLAVSTVHPSVSTSSDQRELLPPTATPIGTLRPLVGRMVAPAVTPVAASYPSEAINSSTRIAAIPAPSTITVTAAPRVASVSTS